MLHDELDIPFDTVRLKTGGGHGGHNGIRDIAAAIGTGDFTRVRIGIGRPPGRQDAADYVLSPFSSAEREVLPNLLSDAADATELLITEGLLAAQQRFHAPRETPTRGRVRDGARRRRATTTRRSGPRARNFRAGARPHRRDRPLATPAATPTSRSSRGSACPLLAALLAARGDAQALLAITATSREADAVADAFRAYLPERERARTSRPGRPCRTSG